MKIGFPAGHSGPVRGRFFCLSAPFPGLFSSFGEEQNFYSREKICVSALRFGAACSVKAEVKRGGESCRIQIITGDFGCFPGNLKILLRFPILA
ncbi:UNVERIFIED_ORG: hypothetical protein B5F06_10265 [Lacrimispora saccharolytica]|nr:hypothetical protein DW757_02745 [Clostridium sp. AM29-11AC]